MKFFGWMGAAIAALVMAGCASGGGAAGSDSAAAGGGPTPVASGQKPEIGVSIPAATHGWTGGIVWWAEQAKKQYPEANITVVQADTAEKQINDIENLMAKGVDALVVLPMASEPLTPVAEKVAQKGIYLVSVDRGFSKPVANLYLEGDNEAFGRVAAEFISQKLNGKGKIAVLEGIPSVVNTARVNAAMEVFKANPGITIAAQQPAEWNREKALQVMQQILVQHPDLNAVWAADDDMALGVEQALKERNMTNVWIVGGGGSKQVVKKVMDGEPMFPATVTYSPSMIFAGIHWAVSATALGADKTKMGALPQHIKINTTLVTKENAKQFYFPDSVY